ncbi:MAG: hypothetical protein WD872_08350 [Pirellulaceae bacterium]
MPAETHIAMDDTIRYLNTDLDLTSASDLTGLAAAFEAQGVFALHLTHSEDGLWYATFETNEDHHEADSNIAAMLAAVESLDKPLRAVWGSCTRREFNIGYDCGSKPWAFNQGLSSDLLGRLAIAGASVRITLYPPERFGTLWPGAAKDG